MEDRAVIDNIKNEEKWSELQFIDTGLFQRFPFSSVVKSQLNTNRTYLHILSYSDIELLRLRINLTKFCPITALFCVCNGF